MNIKRINLDFNSNQVNFAKKREKNREKKQIC